jgi:lysyl-tRNA synthetase class 2
MSEQEIREERLKKLSLLKEAGVEAYPAQTDRTHSIRQFLADFDALVESSTTVRLAGRILALRGQGGIMFADISDGSSRAQVVVQAEHMSEDAFGLFGNTADVGDVVCVEGRAFVTKRGARSLQASGWTMLAKSLRALPSAHFGLKDEETRLRLRAVDLLLDEDLHAVFERKAAFWRVIRAFLEERGFLEVETPVLETSPGGADARPFITHHNALDIDVYLRISAGELWQKRLLVAGYPKVFEIGRIFRNEGQSREHLQDYTQLETYEAFSSLKEGGEFVQELYRRIAKEVYGKYTFEINGHTVDLADEWEVIDFCERIKNTYGIDPLACSEEEAIEAIRDAGIETREALNKARAIDHLWKKLRKNISGPAFLVGVPVFLEPLAKRHAKNPQVVERLQVILAGSEIGKGFSELNDPLDQRARFEDQQRQRDAGDDEAQRLDEDYIRDMEFGMPPSFGFGVSERLFAFLENRPIHECQLFPLLRPR